MSPRLSPTAEFREAWVLRKARAIDYARFLDCPRTQLGRWMCAAQIAATPQTVERLTMLALLLGYRGELFR